ncbi:MAG: lysine exporter protein LysE/YggA [Halomonadaceae bacterium T82-2]|nr:MAG: lysine exporter protein LysE/YggA [Halomonadaceae bacterium T82-2]
MDPMLWLTYVGVITALIAFPGPVALLCTSQGLRHGRRRALFTIAGGIVAALVMMSLSAMGLGAVLATSETAFTLLKYLGAAYLIYLGVQAWRAPPEPQTLAAHEAEDATPVSAWQLFRRGFTVGISNPKDLLFFAALFPGFIDLGAPQAPQFAILALTWLVIDGGLMTLYSSLGERLGRWLGTRRRVRRFNRLTGGLFVVAGGSLAGTH